MSGDSAIALQPGQEKRNSVSKQKTKTCRNVSEFRFFPFSLPSSPVADDVIQPAAPADLESPSLAASSYHGDVVGQVSTDLIAQRYDVGALELVMRPQGPILEAAFPRSPPFPSPPLFSPAVSPPLHTHTGCAHLS